jgi:hypothetical protein
VEQISNEIRVGYADQEMNGLLATGFDGNLKKPFHVRQVIESIEDAVAVTEMGCEGLGDLGREWHVVPV